LEERVKILLEQIERDRGWARPWHPILAERDTEFTEMWHNVVMHALYRDRALSRKVKEIICVVMDALTNYEKGLRIHVRGALEHGASEEEVLEALELCSIIGGHNMTIHLPAFAEEVEEYKKSLEP
jgi:alkylhydroperoxidase/carboxymuconolactone decarboxylase family protein YurZ